VSQKSVEHDNILEKNNFAQFFSLFYQSFWVYFIPGNHKVALLDLVKWRFIFDVFEKAVKLRLCTFYLEMFLRMFCVVL